MIKICSQVKTFHITKMITATSSAVLHKTVKNYTNNEQAVIHNDASQNNHILKDL